MQDENGQDGMAQHGTAQDGTATERFDVSDIRRAAERLRGRVVRTPLMTSEQLDRLAGCRIVAKVEALQHTGSFKYRGALNKVLGLDEATRRRGLVAFSAGNHGAAVAAAAHGAGTSAVIVLPSTAPAVKVENCRAWGAETVFYDPETEDREEVGRRVAEPRGMTVIPPFDDHAVIAGQGTAGLEMVGQLAEKGLVPDALLVCCSGGGLAAGVTEALRDAFPALPCYVVEPAGLNKMALSLAAAAPQPRPRGTTVMDGIAGPVAGRRPLEILRRHGARGVAVDDAEALRAVWAAWRFLKVALEPAGAAALAAALAGRPDLRGRCVAVICSGGNVDEAMFARALAAGAS